MEYRIINNVGKAKYVVSWHDGVSTHKDGSKFFDVAIFKSKEKMNQFILALPSTIQETGLLERVLAQSEK